MLRGAIFFFLCLVTLAHVLRSPGGDPKYYVRLKTTDSRSVRKQLHKLDYDVVKADHVSDTLYLVLSDLEMDALQSLREKMTLIVNRSEPVSTVQDFSTQVPAGYHDLASVNSFLFFVQKAHPQIAKVVDIAREFGPGATHENRSIYAIKLSSGAQQPLQDKPSILIVATHHPREVVVPEIALHIITQLSSNYGQDPVITKLLNDYQIWIVPVVNPDGFNHVFTANNWWRKNKRNLGNGIYGVDLNRNYDIGWQKCVQNTSLDEEIYKGPAPVSEPEVQSIVGLSDFINPAKVLDFHSFGNEVLTGYMCTPIPPMIGKYINQTGRDLAATVGFGTRPPTDDGEEQEYQISRHTNYAFLVEVGQDFQPPFSTCIKDVAKVWKLVQRFFETSIPLVGYVRDANTGKPIQASITIKDVNWQAGETRRTHNKFGSYHLFLPTGQHQITFSARGYIPSTIRVELSDKSTMVRNVALQKQILSKQ